MSQPTFARCLTHQEQDALYQRISQNFTFHTQHWHPLKLNNQPLGLLNEKWRTLLLRDWPEQLAIEADGALNLQTDNWLTMADCLQHIATIWHQTGEFSGWRNEKFDVQNSHGQPLFALERSAFRPLGLFSHAIHINGLAEHQGHWHFWIGRRSPFKAVDPNKLDNLVGGGVASSETIHQAMLRESWEEAGLPENLLQSAHPLSQIITRRTVSRGLHREYLHIFDIELPSGLQPINQDGEVAEFILMDLEELLPAMIEGKFMNDALIATLDLCLRRHLLDAAHPLSTWLKQQKPV